MSYDSQVEEVRNPALRNLPLGVTQKYLIVTCNYEARKAGASSFEMSMGRWVGARSLRGAASARIMKGWGLGRWQGGAGWA